MKENKTVRVSVSLPESIAVMMKAHVIQNYNSQSAFITEAIKEKIRKDTG